MFRRIHCFVFIIFLSTLILCVPLSTYILAAPNQLIYKSQEQLIELGYNPGPIDGILGKRTRAALLKFQRDRGLPQTGNVDNATKLQLNSSNNFTAENNTDNQITPPEIIGTCLEIQNLIKEYQKDTDQFNEYFNEIPLCITGYPSSVKENPNYFYINISENHLETNTLPTDLNLQCRIEKLNDLHRKILKQSLRINTEEKVQVKGLYQSSTNPSAQTLVLDQCYLVRITGQHN